MCCTLPYIREYQWSSATWKHVKGIFRVAATSNWLCFPIAVETEDKQANFMLLFLGLILAAGSNDQVRRGASGFSVKNPFTGQSLRLNTSLGIKTLRDLSKAYTFSVNVFQTFHIMCFTRWTQTMEQVFPFESHRARTHSYRAV